MTGDKKKVRGRRNMLERQYDINGWDTDSTDSMSPVDREVLNSKMFLMRQTDPDQPSL